MNDIFAHRIPIYGNFTIQLGIAHNTNTNNDDQFTRQRDRTNGSVKSTFFWAMNSDSVGD
jgi:hypothetical protein